MTLFLFKQTIGQPDSAHSKYWNDPKHVLDHFEWVIYFDGPKDSNCKGEPTPSIIFGRQACLAESTKIYYTEGKLENSLFFYKEITQGHNAFAVYCPSKDLLHKAFLKFNEDVKKHGIEMEEEKETVSQRYLENILLHHVSKLKALGSALTYKNSNYDYKEFYVYSKKVYFGPFDYEKTLTKQSVANGKRNNVDNVAILFRNYETKDKHDLKKQTVFLKGRCYFFEEVKDFGDKTVGYIWGLIKEEDHLDEMLFGFAKNAPPLRKDVFKKSEADSLGSNDNTHTDIHECLCLSRHSQQTRVACHSEEKNVRQYDNSISLIKI